MKPTLLPFPMVNNSVLLRLSLDLGTGFDGLAVAPIVNGESDYKSIAVIAARTDPGNPTKIDRCKTTFSYYSVIL